MQRMEEQQQRNETNVDPFGLVRRGKEEEEEEEED